VVAATLEATAMVAMRAAMLAAAAAGMDAVSRC